MYTHVCKEMQKICSHTLTHTLTRVHTLMHEHMHTDVFSHMLMRTDIFAHTAQTHMRTRDMRWVSTSKFVKLQSNSKLRQSFSLD